MLKDTLFNKKISKSMFLVELILVLIFSFFTLYFIDIGNISSSIITELATVHDTSESFRYLIEWFVICLGSIVGTAVIYYAFFDFIIISTTLIAKDIIKLKKKLNKGSS